MNLDRRLLELLKETRLSFVLSVLFALFAGLATIAFAYFLSLIIDGVFLKGYNLSQTSLFLLWLVLFGLARAFFNWAAQAAGSRTASSIKLCLRRKLLSRISDAGPFYLKDQRSGEISNTVLNGVEALDVYFSQYIPQLFNALIIPLTILFIVFPLDVLSGIILLVTAPLIPVFMVLIGDAAKKKTQKQWLFLSRMSAHFLDVLQGLTTLKIFGRSKEQLLTISQISDRFRRKTMDVLKIAFLSALVLEMTATISTAIIAVEVGLRLLYSRIEFQQALFLLILAPEFYQPLRQLGARFHAGMEGVNAAERIYQIVTESKSYYHQRTSPAPKPVIFEPVKFKQVYHQYPGALDFSLKNISFEMNPNSVTALIGSSGAGKTTISNLLLQFINPDSGSILTGQTPISEIARSQWLENIAFVAQKPYLFHRSIAENIKLSRPRANYSEIIEAAQKARLHDFIKSLPDGYDTIIGEQGARLSGGQGQRLALARAFLKDAPLLILDEPTANLDPQLEAQLTSIIMDLTKSRTTLMVAHRLSTIRSADQIIVLSDGCIKETGNHKELVYKNGHYAALLSASGVIQ